MTSIFTPFIINITACITMLSFYIYRFKVSYSGSFQSQDNNKSIHNIFFKIEKILSLIFLTTLGVSLFFINQTEVINVGGWVSNYSISLSFSKMIGVYLACIIICFFYTLRKDFNTLNPKLNECFLIYLLLFCIYGIIITNDLFNLYVWVEILMFSSIGLLLKSHLLHINKPVKIISLDKVSSAAQDLQKKISNPYISRYIIFNIITGSLILMLIASIYRASGTLNIRNIFLIYNPSVEFMTCVLISIFLVKAGVLISCEFMSQFYDSIKSSEKVLFLTFITKVNIFAIIKLISFVDYKYKLFFIFMNFVCFFTLIRTVFVIDKINMFFINSSAMMLLLEIICRIGVLYGISSIIFGYILITDLIKKKHFKFLFICNALPVPLFMSFYSKLWLIFFIFIDINKLDFNKGTQLWFCISTVILIGLYSVVYCYRIIPLLKKDENTNQHWLVTLIIVKIILLLTSMFFYASVNYIVFFIFMMMLFISFLIYYQEKIALYNKNHLKANTLLDMDNLYIVPVSFVFICQAVHFLMLFKL